MPKDKQTVIDRSTRDINKKTGFKKWKRTKEKRDWAE